MNHYVKADRMIGELVKSGKKKFILFPFGEQGTLVKSILNNRYGIEEELIVDNKLSKISCNKKIVSIEELENVNMDNKLVLLTSDSNKIYSEIRYELLQYVPFDKIVDIFSVSMYFDKKVFWEKPYSNHPRLCALETTAREIYYNKVEGAIAECGVYKGWFANYMSRFMPDRKFYLFDTFSGFDERDIDEKEKNYSAEFRKTPNFHDTSVEIALNNIAWRANTIVRKGYFPDTAAGLEDERFAFVSLDTDLYKPILAGLEFFYPRMNPGGVIFVDDLGHKDLLGVREAVVEFCKKEKIGYISAFDGIDATAIIVKPLE
ncbi:MAG: class I SAM-dependent methyltransferase [Lachnospiraceae bacterium]|nr:class I SAM-dependent methyltransferase [Lachnospiraceae bacterium]